MNVLKTKEKVQEPKVNKYEAAILIAIKRGEIMDVLKKQLEETVEQSIYFIKE